MVQVGPWECTAYASAYWLFATHTLPQSVPAWVMVDIVSNRSPPLSLFPSMLGAPAVRGQFRATWLRTDLKLYSHCTATLSRVNFR
jgi:hypothetical protein